MSDATSSSSQVQRPAIAPDIPQVLTRNVIPKLTADLDASDVVECYNLVRSAPLHGIANATIHIHKTALGFRYRPPGGAASGHLEKRPFEMTLEYGPQRFGPSLNHDAMPYIQVSEQESSFIGWENVGRVFYTTKILTESYLSSYYMASMTGAVLNKILIEAVDYAERRRRYQPFAVFSVENGREVRSSSSVDFAQYVWKKLANLGVEIVPILPPPIYEARLWVRSWEKVVPQPSIANEAAAFYQKLYQCLEAIATNDYSAYTPTAQPTISPQPTALPTISISTVVPDDDNSTSTIPQDGEEKLAPDADSSSETAATTDAPTSALTEEQSTQDGNDGSGGRRRFRSRRAEGEDTDDDYAQEDDILNDELMDNDKAADDDTAGGDDDLADNTENDIVGATPEPIFEKTTNPTPTPPPTTISTPGNAVPPSGEDDVEKAKKAAADAQQAADEAKNAAQSEGETKAADAAQAAANAAQAAADATSNAAAQAAMEGLLSGDGSTMTSIVTSCLTNTQYDIASVDENGTVTVHAFLYLDGSNYYKLNMTSPYLEIAKVNRGLPQAVTLSGVGGGGELIDFVLAVLVLGLVLMMGVAILQQMGFECFTSFYRCQRWFFNPRKYDYEGSTFDDDDDDNLFNFGEDGIPLSMGGRLSHVSPIAVRNVPNTGKDWMSDSPELRIPALKHRGSSHSDSRARSPIELEMSSLPSARMRTDSHGSMSDDELEVDSAVVPQRLYRDPDLVDMPYLKSTSKVAVPVGSSSNGGSGHGKRTLFDSDFEEHEYRTSNY